MSAWENKKVFVTGADGFIGGALVARLINERARVHANVLDTNLRFPNYAEVERVFNVDLTDYDRLAQVMASVKPDVVYHLAAVTQVKDAELMPRQTMRVNVMGTVNVIEAVIHHAGDLTRIIVASSDKAYGEPLDQPLSIESRLNPIHPYDASKAAADLIAQSYGKFYDWPILVTRMANVFGPGDENWQRLIPGVIRDIMEERQPYIRSDGSPVREYIYIDDVVDAYLVLGAIELGREDYGQVFNFAPSRPYSVMEIVEKILVVMHSDLEPTIAGVSKTETQKITLDDRFTRERLSWEPKRELDDALVVTTDWIAERLFNKERDKRWFQLR